MPRFYHKVLGRLLRDGEINRDARLLVVCGGKLDHDVLRDLGFRHVTISNLDGRMNEQSFAPFAWSYQDAEALAYPDDAFDFVLVHAGLHHCHSPHRALLEMYRVARRGLLAFEARDGWLMR